MGAVVLYGHDLFFLCLEVFLHQRDTKEGTAIDLLADAPKRKRHPRAESYAELAQRIAAAIHETLDESPSAMSA